MRQMGIDLPSELQAQLIIPGKTRVAVKGKAGTWPPVGSRAPRLNQPMDHAEMTLNSRCNVSLSMRSYGKAPVTALDAADSVIDLFADSVPTNTALQ